jgi:hypothetical protein
LHLYSTAVSDLTPIWHLYSIHGAFSDPDNNNYININGCNMDITPGSSNYTIVSNLINAGVLVVYGDGNQIYTQVIAWEDVFTNPNGAYIHGMTYDGAVLWMVGRDTNLIYRVDATDGSVLTTIPSPTTATDGTGLTYDGSSLWYTHDQSPRMIYEVDPADGTVLSSFAAPGGGDSTGLAWDGTYLWNTGFGENIYQLDTAGNVQTSFTAPTDTPEGMTYANGYLWTIGYYNTLYKLDPADGTIVASYSTPPASLYGLTSDGTNRWLSTNDGWIKRYPLSGL